MQLITLPRSLEAKLNKQLKEFSGLSQKEIEERLSTMSEERVKTLSSFVKMLELRKRLNYMEKVPRMRVNKADDITRLKLQIAELESDLSQMDF